jgi:putative membrane protein
MKTMKAIPQLLVAGTMVFGFACSSSNMGTDTGAGTTSGSATGTSMDATSGSAGTSGRADTGANMGTNNSSSSYPEIVPNTGNANADMTAFMATFATMQDPVFLMTAASSNMMEIQLGQMAAQKSTNADVKRFGQMMVDHHTKATQQLKTVATPLGVTLPQTLMPVHQAMVDKVMNKTGKDFDEAYMDAMEAAHKMDIAMFEVKDKAADTPTVKSFATKTLPMLRSHEKMADEIEDKVD